MPDQLWDKESDSWLTNGEALKRMVDVWLRDFRGGDFSAFASVVCLNDLVAKLVPVLAVTGLGAGSILERGDEFIRMTARSFFRSVLPGHLGNPLAAFEFHAAWGALAWTRWYCT